MKQTFIVEAKELQENDYLCNLHGIVKEVKDLGTHLAVIYDCGEYEQKIEPTYEYEFAVIREVK